MALLMDPLMALQKGSCLALQMDPLMALQKVSCLALQKDFSNLFSWLCRWIP